MRLRKKKCCWVYAITKARSLDTIFYSLKQDLLHMKIKDFLKEEQ